MTTTTTTFPTDTTSARPTGRRHLGAATGVALGVALGAALGAAIGWFAASAAADDPAATIEPATAVAELVPSPLVMSPDAMTRWATPGSAAVIVTAPLVMSPDAMTRWAEADAAHQERVDRAACGRLSQGLADC